MSDPDHFPSALKLSRAVHPADLIPGPSFASTRRSAGRSYAQEPIAPRSSGPTGAGPTGKPHHPARRILSALSPRRAIRRTRQAGQAAMANISSQLQRLHFTDRRRVLANKGITAPPLLERDSVFGTANRYLLAPAPPTWSNRYCRPLQAEPHSPPGGPGVEMADTSVPDTFDAPRRASSVSESDKFARERPRRSVATFSFRASSADTGQPLYHGRVRNERLATAADRRTEIGRGRGLSYHGRVRTRGMATPASGGTELGRGRGFPHHGRL